MFKIKTNTCEEISILGKFCDNEIYIQITLEDGEIVRLCGKCYMKLGNTYRGKRIDKTESK